MIGHLSTEEKIASVAILIYKLNWEMDDSTILLAEPDFPALNKEKEKIKNNN